MGGGADDVVEVEAEVFDGHGVGYEFGYYFAAGYEVYEGYVGDFEEHAAKP